MTGGGEGRSTKFAATKQTWKSIGKQLMKHVCDVFTSLATLAHIVFFLATIPLEELLQKAHSNSGKGHTGGFSTVIPGSIPWVENHNSPYSSLNKPFNVLCALLEFQLDAAAEV